MKVIFTVVLPHTDVMLSPNQNVPLAPKAAAAANRERARKKKVARTFAYLTAKAQGVNGQTPRPDAYCIRWFYKGGRPDLDNLPTRCKAYLDGVCQALNMDDGDIEEMVVIRERSLKRAGEVMLSFGTI